MAGAYYNYAVAIRAFDNFYGIFGSSTFYIHPILKMVSIILPTYNEAPNIIELIEELFKNVAGPLEIIVVDDDSPDETWRLVELYNNPNVKLIRRMELRGLATAIYAGIKESKGDIIGWMDADMCMPASNLKTMLLRLSECDIAIGSRYVKGGGDIRRFYRVFFSRAINWFAGLLLGFDIKDYDSGFALFKRHVFDKVTFPPGGYGDYFIELIFKSKNANFKIEEVPYVFKRRTKGKSKTTVNVFHYIRLGFSYILKIIALKFFRERR